MTLRTHGAFYMAQLFSFVSKLLKLGSGVTWAGEVALRIDPNLFSIISKKLDKVIIVSGTNGKTTTASMLAHIFEKNNYSVIHNTSGANLKNGIMGTFILQYKKIKYSKKCIAIFEVDEAEFSNIVPLLYPDVIVLLNLFRDQLDRYGEVNELARKWKLAINRLESGKYVNLKTGKPVIILNADDPLVSLVGFDTSIPTKFFGLNNKFSVIYQIKDLWGDSYNCPLCGSQLKYNGLFFSHLGDWYCTNCGIKHHKNDIDGGNTLLKLSGKYNQYNAAAALLTAKTLGIDISKNILSDFIPVFGRQEHFFVKNKNIQMFLSKNPTGFNESIRTVLGKENADTIIVSLNDRIPDGTDVSWIWDIDFEPCIKSNITIICTGDRAWDLAVRLKYEQKINDERLKVKIEPDYKKALKLGLEISGERKTLYILPTYSAMLDLRKVLTGRKIL